MAATAVAALADSASRLSAAVSWSHKFWSVRRHHHCERLRRSCSWVRPIAARPQHDETSKQNHKVKQRRPADAVRRPFGSGRSDQVLQEGRERRGAQPPACNPTPGRFRCKTRPSVVLASGTVRHQRVPPEYHSSTKKRLLPGLSRDGSDGTRTRDLRRDSSGSRSGLMPRIPVSKPNPRPAKIPAVLAKSRN
jgi:hypothetical protein